MLDAQNRTNSIQLISALKSHHTIKFSANLDKIISRFKLTEWNIITPFTELYANLFWFYFTKFLDKFNSLNFSIWIFALLLGLSLAHARSQLYTKRLTSDLSLEAIL